MDSINKDHLRGPVVGQYETVDIGKVYKPMRVLMTDGTPPQGFGGSRRFGSNTTGVPGPGTYVANTEPTMMKKTYNVTIT